MNDFDTPISLDDLTEMRDHLRDFLALYDLHANDEANANAFRDHCEHVIIELDDRIRERKGTPMRLTMSAADFEGDF